MEDQPADPGDLTPGADPTSIPQGKAARSRHRLPRQNVRDTRSGDIAAGVADDVGEDVGEAAAEVEPAEPVPVLEPSDDTAVPEVAAHGETVHNEMAAVSQPRRRRFPWRRDKAAGMAAEQLDPIAETASESNDDTVAEPTKDATESATDPTSTADASHAEAAEAGDVDGQHQEADVVLVPHRPAGRAFKVVAVAAGVLFVAAGAFAGATLQPYLSDRAAVQRKLAIAETAANAITTLWTYTPENMATLPDRSAKYLGGDFEADYRRYIDAIIEPNKQAKITNDTQVLGVAVEALTSTDASALVYTNSVATSPVTKGIPSLRYLSYRLTLEARDRKWLITKMTAVTSLDLTPRL